MGGGGGEGGGGLGGGSGGGLGGGLGGGGSGGGDGGSTQKDTIMFVDEALSRERLLLTTLGGAGSGLGPEPNVYKTAVGELAL